MRGRCTVTEEVSVKVEELSPKTEKLAVKTEELASAFWAGDPKTQNRFAMK